MKTSAHTALRTLADEARAIGPARFLALLAAVIAGFCAALPLLVAILAGE